MNSQRNRIVSAQMSELKKKKGTDKEFLSQIVLYMRDIKKKPLTISKPTESDRNLSRSSNTFNYN